MLYKNNMNQTQNKILIELSNVTKTFSVASGAFHALRDGSLKISKGKLIAITGKSGSGKSITSLALMGLLPHNALVEGELLFEELSLKDKSNKEWRKIRGNQIAMIFHF